MNTPGIRWSSVIPGLVCVLLGVVWALQGAGLIGGSFMTRQTLWIWVGTALAVVGLLLVYRGLPRSAKQA